MGSAAKDSTSTSATAAAATAESAKAKAYLELIRSKPPPNLEGLFSFVAELRNNHFSEHEQVRMIESESGRQLSNAIRQCAGLRNKIQQLSQAPLMKDQHPNNIIDRHVSDYEKDSTRLKRKAIKNATFEYIDCVSFKSCPSRWKEYSQCWSSLTRLTADELKQLLETHGGLQIVCARERHNLERCVGNLVMNTVREAASSSSSPDLFGHDDNSDLFPIVEE